MSNLPQGRASRAKASSARDDAPGSRFGGAIEWCGPLFTPTGYGDEARGFVKGLRGLGFPVKAVPVQTVLPFAEQVGADDPSFFLDVVESMKLEDRRPLVAVSHGPATVPFGPAARADYTIARTMWETDRLFQGCAERLNTVDEIWVPTRFNEEVFRESGVTKPIRVVGAGVDTRRFRPSAPPLKLPGRRESVFLSIFEWSYRKGWDALLRAWAAAFDPADDVTLVLRIYPRNKFLNTDALQHESEVALESGLAELGLRRAQLAPIIVIGRHLAAAEMPRLITAADCYVGPSRGEGWGRPYQEAMSCGRPAIATRWGGNLGFMDDTNSLLVDVESLVAVDQRMDVPHYAGQRWAEPSVDHLSELLRRVASDRLLRRNIGQKARADMESSWQWHDVASRAGAALEQIRERIGSAEPRARTASIATSAEVRGRSPVLLLADASELVEDDRVLAAFARAFTGSDDVSLLAYGVGLDPVTFEILLRERAGTCGIDLENGPKILAILPPSATPDQDREVASKVSAFITARPPNGAFAGLAVIDPNELLGPRKPVLADVRQAQSVYRSVPSEPLVSVLVPSFNRAGYLEQCLVSIVGQTYGSLEILVVDDRSTDGAQEVAEELARIDARVRVVHNDERLGLVGNHRRCLELATGEFVKFVHTDDRLRPHAIRRLLDSLSSRPDATIASAARDVIDAGGAPQPPIASTTRVSEIDDVFEGIPFGNALLTSGINLVGEPTSVLFRRSHLAPHEFSALAGRTYTSLLDISTWLSLLSRGRLVYTAEPLTEVRIHASQEGRAIGAVREHLEWLDAVEDARTLGFLADPELEARAIQTFAGRLVTLALQSPGPEARAVALAVERALERLAQLKGRDPTAPAALLQLSVV